MYPLSAPSLKLGADRVEIRAAAGAVRPATWVHAVERGGSGLERLDLMVKLYGLLRVRFGLWENHREVNCN